jgi:YVTN family beta-propeller protein
MTRSLLAAAWLALIPQIGVQAQQHTVITLSHSDHTVYELDAATGRILHTFLAEDQPHEATVSPDGRTIYAAIPAAGHVAIIDAPTFTLRGKIESEHFRRSDGGSTSPHGIAITSDGSKVYIGTERAEIPGIVVYDTRAGRVLKKIDVMLEGGHFLAIDPRTNKLYYPMRTDNRVVVIDTRTDQVTKIIPVEGGPVGVDFTPNGEVWIHSDYDGSVTVIDMRTDEVIQRITNTGTGAGRIAVSPDGRYAASTHGTSGDVAIIDTRTRMVVARVPVASLGFPLFSPDSSKLYVMTARNYVGTPPSIETVAAGGVTVIDLRTMKAVARHPVGVNPFGGQIRYVSGRPPLP